MDALTCRRTICALPLSLLRVAAERPRAYSDSQDDADLMDLWNLWETELKSSHSAEYRAAKEQELMKLLMARHSVVAKPAKKPPRKGAMPQSSAICNPCADCGGTCDDHYGACCRATVLARSTHTDHQAEEHFWAACPHHW